MTNISSGRYTFQLGECFNSYDDLLERLEKHSRESFVFYWRRDTRTVEGAIMKTTRPISKCLKYYSVRYACIHGGQKYAGRGEGHRKSNTLRSNCPSFIMLRASKCGQQLKVIGVCNDHNHEISELTIRALPQSRKLTDDTKEEVLEMLNLHIDRKKIIEYVLITTKKHLTIKDLLNMKARHRNKIDEAPKSLQKRKDAVLRRIEDVCGIQNEEKSVAISLPTTLIDLEPETYYEINSDDLPVSPYSGDYDNIIESPSRSDGNNTNELDAIDVDINDKEPAYHVDVECMSPGEAYETMEPYDNVSDIIEVEGKLQNKPIEPSTTLPTPKRRTFRQPKRHRQKGNAGKFHNCGHCCLNARLIQKRIDVLKAKEQKLIEETHILRLTKERLISEADGTL